MPHRIAVLSGDGIGPEVMPAALELMEAALGEESSHFIFEEAWVGGKAIDQTGHPLPKESLSLCEKSSAILFGSVGGPKWESLPPEKRPERGALLPLRRHFELFANLRPVKLYPELASSSPLDREITQKGIDLLMVRELTGGIYFGKPSGRQGAGKEEKGFDTMLYHRWEIERIAEVAFAAACKRKRKVTSVDKANVLSSMLFWREVVSNFAKDYNSKENNSKKNHSVELEHMYVDNAAMQIISSPHNFDVLLCGNLFGDILSDEASVLGGSLGMLASASLSSRKSEIGHFGLYEPAGGSAPDIAGKGLANPIAQILSGALLLRYSFGMDRVAKKIERAVHEAIQNGARTADLLPHSQKQKAISTSEMGQEIRAKIKGKSKLS